MGNQAGSLKKHIETAEKTGDSRILYGFDTILLSAIDQYSRCPLLFWPEVGKIPTWTDKGDQVSHNDFPITSPTMSISGCWELEKSWPVREQDQGVAGKHRSVQNVENSHHGKEPSGHYPAGETIYVPKSPTNNKSSRFHYIPHIFKVNRY